MSLTYYIGLDVHKNSVAIAYATSNSREKPIFHGSCGGSNLAVERALRALARKLAVPFKELEVCYEAGPTGFVLARRLIQLGLSCVVMAPSKTERKPNDKIKTDKHDAIKIAKAFRDGKQFQNGGFPTPVRPALAPDAPKALIFSPHPDDECIIGGLALRLLKESGVRVINVAVTQGSNRDRQQARLEELKGACDYMGFGLITTGENGLEGINPKRRESDPEAWSKDVEVIQGILQKEQPAFIFVPHATDWNSTHIGVHCLVMDALAKLPSETPNISFNSLKPTQAFTISTDIMPNRTRLSNLVSFSLFKRCFTK